ncbi:MAG: YaaA family protein [Candidatus Izemoplasmatales bacterium]
MKFIISPSKTMVGYFNQKYEATIPPFQDDAFKIVKKMKKFTIEELMQSYVCSEKIAVDNQERFNHFGSDIFHALFSYTGHQYKNINPVNLNEEAIHFLQDHLVILSGLYGALRPLDGISLYRLPMDFKLNNRKMSQLHKKKLKELFAGETLINLASEEYSNVISKDINMITIDFLYENKGKMKIDSMEAKKMRGLFVRYIAENKIDSLNNLRLFDQFGYRFNEEFSSEKRLVYLKK